MKELHFHSSLKQDTYLEGINLTYRLHDRTHEFAVDDIVSIVIDDDPPYKSGQARIVAIELLHGDEVSDIILDYLELYYGTQTRDAAHVTVISYTREGVA